MEATPHHYSEEEGRRTVWVLMCALWFALSGCVLLVRASRWLRQKWPIPLLVFRFDCLSRLCQASMRFIAGAGVGRVEDQVAQELQKRRLIRAHALLPYVQLGVTIAMGSSFYRISSPEPRMMTPAQDVCWLMVCFTVLFAWTFPCFLTLKTLDIWSSILIACTALMVSPFAMNASYASYFTIGPYALVMVLSLLNLHVWLNLLWLLIITLSHCSTIMFGLETNRDCSPARADIMSHVLLGACVLGTVILSFRMSIFMMVQYQLEAYTSRNELEAARSVLRAVCDVTVELDDVFRLQDESPELVDLLLLNPRRSLPGEDLRSFLASEQDRQKFSEQMGRASLQDVDAAVGLCAAFHVCMKDGSGIPLDVEVFSVRFINRECEPAYFVGIREYTDTSPLLKDTAVAAHNGGRRGHLQSVPSIASQSPNKSAEGASENLPDASSASFVQGEAEILREAEPAAWIEILTRGYAVRYATPKFMEHVDANGQFLSAVAQSQRFDFISWAQEVYPALLEGGPSPAREEYRERLHLRSPSRPPAGAARTRGATISAIVHLDLSPPPGRRRCGEGLARVALQDIREARRAPREGPRQGTPAAGAGGPRGQPAPPAAPPEVCGKEEDPGARAPSGAPDDGRLRPLVELLGP